jgi:hypothetical protein
MKKDPESQPDDEMLPEYDFRGGVRGKHFRAYQQGHTVEIHRADGTTEDGLRKLIELTPDK